MTVIEKILWYLRQLQSTLLMFDGNILQKKSLYIMLKRREIFLKQIRKQERENIKNRLRMKLIAEQSQFPLEIETHHVHLNEQFRCIEAMFSDACNRQLNCSFLDQFFEQMHELMQRYFKDELQCECNLNPLNILAAFSQHLTTSNATQLQSMLQCFQQGLKIKNNNFQTILIDNLEMQDSQFIIKWNSAFNMIFLIILHSKSAKQSSFSPQFEEKIDFYYSDWIEKTCTTFQVLTQQTIEFNVVYHQSIIQCLKEISSYCKLSISRQIPSLIDRMFNKRMIKGLQRIFSSYRMDKSAKLLVTDIYLHVVKGNLVDAYNKILQNDICEAIRFMIAFETNFNATRRDHQVVAQEKLIENILEFILQGSYLNSSDIFWQAGICSQLRLSQRSGVNNKILHQDIITVLFVCITAIKKQSTAVLIQESQVFEWVLQVLKECIQCRYSDPSLTELITDAISVLRFFYQLGEMIKIKDNPYLIKLQYSFGISILESCIEGMNFLQEIGWIEEEL